MKKKLKVKEPKFEKYKVLWGKYYAQGHKNPLDSYNGYISGFNEAKRAILCNILNAHPEVSGDLLKQIYELGEKEVLA